MPIDTNLRCPECLRTGVRIGEPETVTTDLGDTLVVEIECAAPQPCGYWTLATRPPVTPTWRRGRRVH